MRNLRTEQEIMATWKGDVATPVVSIDCITYNHELYIEDALEGFLIQETDFPIEILIHDDASTDSTANIIKEYEAAYPNIIKPIYQTKNQFSKGKNPIVEFNFPRAKGEYIALCEGDDYWIDKKKLQKQISFLKKNNEYSSSCHQSIIKYEGMNLEKKIFGNNSDEISIKKLMKGRTFHTASFVFRANILEKNIVPSDILSFDRYMFLLCALIGKIKFFQEVMCIYRKHEGGISSWITYDLLKKDLKIPMYLLRVNNKFPKYEYLFFVHQTLITYPKKVPLNRLIYHYLMYLILSFSNFPRNTIDVAKFSLIYVPIRLCRYFFKKSEFNRKD